MDREDLCTVVHGVARSQTQLSDWTELNWWLKGPCCFFFFFFLITLLNCKWQCNTLQFFSMSSLFRFMLLQTIGFYLWISICLQKMKILWNYIKYANKLGALHYWFIVYPMLVFLISHAYFPKSINMFVPSLSNLYHIIYINK